MAEIVKEPWVERWEEHEIEYRLKDDDGFQGWFGFPCDKLGNIEKLNPEAQKSYDFVSNNPDYVRSHRVTHRAFKHSTLIRCDCGCEFEFRNEYLRTCQCWECDRWYNEFAQRVLPPHWYNINDY